LSSDLLVNQHKSAVRLRWIRGQVSDTKSVKCAVNSVHYKKRASTLLGPKNKNKKKATSTKHQASSACDNLSHWHKM